jgi:hypothetical protein
MRTFEEIEKDVEQKKFQALLEKYEFRLESIENKVIESLEQTIGKNVVVLKKTLKTSKEALDLEYILLRQGYLCKFVRYDSIKNMDIDCSNKYYDLVIFL